jgi:hypothetical protein
MKVDFLFFIKKTQKLKNILDKNPTADGVEFNTEIEQQENEFSKVTYLYFILKVTFEK